MTAYASDSIAQLLADLDRATEKVDTVLAELGRHAPSRARLRRLRPEGPGEAVGESGGLVDALSPAGQEPESVFEQIDLEPLVDLATLQPPGPTAHWPALVSLAQLGQVLAALPDPIREGFVKAALIADVAMSARLDHRSVSPWELEAADLGAYGHALPSDVAASFRLLQGARAAYGVAGSLFRAGRISLVLQRPRLAGFTEVADDPVIAWLDDRSFDPDDVAGMQRALFSPALLGALKRLDPLLGALAWLWIWHRSGAASVWSGSAGRLLANRWIYERGLLPVPLPFLASSFHGAASGYRPWSADWLQVAVPAVQARTVALRGGLQLWEAQYMRLLGQAGQRKARRRAIDAMTRLGVATAPELAREARLSVPGAQGALAWMQDVGAVEPVRVDRRRWRLFRLTCYTAAWPTR